MEIDLYANIAGRLTEHRSEQIKKEQAAIDFEEIFARQLIREMTKDSFKMGDNSGVMGSSNNLYREFIVDTLAGEIAAQRKLGMADLISKHWSRSK